MKNRMLPRLGASALALGLAVTMAFAADQNPKNVGVRSGSGLVGAQLPAVSAWTKDRTEPLSWEETGVDGAAGTGYITTTVTEQQASNSWYDWQGRSAATNADFTNHWVVETQLVVTEEMMGTQNEGDGIRSSLWIKVDGDTTVADANLDWSIIQFSNDGTQIAWQTWDGQTGQWNNLEGVTPSVGTHTLKTEYIDGTVYQYIDGSLVNQYGLADVYGYGFISAPSGVIIQNRTFGKSYSTTWKIPTVQYAEGYAANTIFVGGEGSAYTDLVSAVNDADAGATIVLEKDITLSQAITISKDVTILGGNHTIVGQADDKNVYLEVTGGTFALSDVVLKDFGGNVSGASGNAVIKVPATAAADTVVNATNVNISNFSRSAYDIRSGSFAITGGTMDCANQVTGESNSKLTKGILAGLGSNKVTGTISGVTVTMSASNYADWNTAAIEVYNNADVRIDGCIIDNVQNGIHVDNYYGSAGQDVSVTVSNTTATATDAALKLYSTYNGKGGAANAKLTVTDGTYTGDVRIVGKTDKDTLSIVGGTFSVNPAEYLETGYAVAENGQKFVVYKTVSEPVQSETDENGNAVINENDMNDAIFSAVQGQKPQVTVHVQTAAGAESVSVTLPTANLGVLAAEENATLTIQSGVGTVSFDKAALTTIAAAGGNQMVLTVAPAMNLTEDQQAVVGDSMAVELTLTAGNTVISQFNGVATVTLPFTLAEGKDASDVIVYYVDEAGNLVACNTTYANGEVTFTTTHFSTYMVTYVEKGQQPSAQPTQQPSAQPSTQPSAQPSQKPNGEQPQTGDALQATLWIGLMVASLGAFAMVRVYGKKRS